MSDAEPLLLSAPREGVRQITLNRPERLNALNEALVEALHAELAEIAADRDCRAVVLTGAGRGFCAGYDIGGYGGAPRADWSDPRRRGWAVQRRIVSLLPAIRRLPQPVVAAVNGPAVGGGLSLTLISDIRLSAESARFGVAGRGVGLSAGDMGVGWLLPRVVGFARAQELMLTARVFDAAEAERVGLVAEVAADGALLDTALEYAERIVAAPGFATELTKEGVWAALETPSLQAAMDIDDRQQAILFESADHREAMAAFLAKRPPRFNQD